jgi:hypothetical protein
MVTQQMDKAPKVHARNVRLVKLVGRMVNAAIVTPGNTAKVAQTRVKRVYIIKNLISTRMAV